MSLEEKLAATRGAAGKRISPALEAIMHDATTRPRNSGIMERVIKPGANVPDFTLPDQSGQMVALSSLLATGAVVISVFRGFW